MQEVNKQEVQVYEELRQDGITYEQSKSTMNCQGCVFLVSDTMVCKGSNTSSDICSHNDTIWIKKAEQVSTPFSTEAQKAGVKYDQEKERYDLVPVLALEEVAKVLTVGAAKYDDENWRKVPNATRRYFSATQRHLAWVRKGQTHDSETGLHHYAHAITNLMFLLEKELELNGLENK